MAELIVDYKLIIDDLLNNFNNKLFKSKALNNVEYQFTDTYSFTSNSKRIKVLLVTAPQQYLQGRILYNNQFTDITSILNKESKDKNKQAIKVFVVPHLVVNNPRQHFYLYDLKIDYVAD